MPCATVWGVAVRLLDMAPGPPPSVHRSLRSKLASAELRGRTLGSASRGPRGTDCSGPQGPPLLNGSSEGTFLGGLLYDLPAFTPFPSEFFLSCPLSCTFTKTYFYLVF